jgi:hypothetical protein
MAVCLPPNPARSVPLYRIPIFSAKGKHDPVIGQSVLYKKQFCPGTGNAFPPLKNIPDSIPSFKPFFP